MNYNRNCADIGKIEQSIKSTSRIQLIECAPKASHKIEAIRINENKIVSCDEGNGEIAEIRWAPDGKSLTFLMHTGGACCSDYMDSLINVVIPRGLPRGFLFSEARGYIPRASNPRRITALYYRTVCLQPLRLKFAGLIVNISFDWVE